MHTEHIEIYGRRSDGVTWRAALDIGGVGEVRV